MLIKLACGYEINPERVSIEGSGDHCIAHIDSLTLPLTLDEQAQIRAYHTKRVVVEASKQFYNDHLATPHIQQNLGRCIKCSGTHYGEPCPYASSQKSNPFTVQDLPKPDAETEKFQYIIKDRSDKFFMDILNICKACQNWTGRPCDGCLSYDGPLAKMTKFKQKEKCCDTCGHSDDECCSSECICPDHKDWTPRT